MAQAEPPAIALSIETAGCPSEDRVRAALDPWLAHRSVDGPAYRLFLERRGDELDVRLESPLGAPSLERTIEARDCEAAAQAVAFILHAHFLALEEAPALAEPPERESRDRPEDVPPPASTVPVPVAPAALPKAQPPTRRSAAPRRVPQGSHFRLGLGMAGGVRGTAEPRALGAAGTLDVSLRQDETPLAFRVAVDAATPIVRHSGVASLRLRETFLRVESGGVWGKRLTVAVMAGVGMGIRHARVSFGDDEDTARRLAPLITVSGGIGYVVTRALHLRSEVTLFAFPLAHRFVITDVGALGRTHRFELRWTTGVTIVLTP